MSRRLARQMTLQALFQMEFSDISGEQALALAQEEQERDVNESSVLYAQALLAGTVAQKDKLDAMIASYAKDWDISRINKVDLTVLRIALYEVYFASDRVRPGVAINEAVEIAKLYCDDESHRFINGVLGKIVRSLPVDDSEEHVSGD